MSLETLCYPYFDEHYRKLGQNLYLRHICYSDPIDETQVDVEIDDGSNIGVQFIFDRRQQTLWAACDCDNPIHYCEHMWAAILELDQTDVFPVSTLSRLALRQFPTSGTSHHGFSPARKATGTAHTVPARRSTTKATTNGHRPTKAKTQDWKVVLNRLRKSPHQVDYDENAWDELRRVPRQIWYVLHLAQSEERDDFYLELHVRETLMSGKLGKIKKLNFSEATSVESEQDRQLIELLSQGRQNGSHYYAYSYTGVPAPGAIIGIDAAAILLPKLCETQRFLWSDYLYGAIDETRVIRWLGNEPWQFRLMVIPDESKKRWRVRGQLEHSTRPAEINELTFLMGPRYGMLRDGTLGKIHCDSEALPWIDLLKTCDEVLVPFKDRKRFQEYLTNLLGFRPEDLPAELQEQIVSIVAPQGKFRIRAPRPGSANRGADVLFVYGEREVELGLPGLRKRGAPAVSRNLEAETRLLRELSELRLKPEQHTSIGCVSFPHKRFVEVVEAMIAKNWIVEVAGGKIRRSGGSQISVTSGVDWFDLEASFDFEGQTAHLPALLEAFHNGENYVTLSDGSRGILPDEWLKKYGTLARLGQVNGDRVRFVASQAALLDALLAAQEGVEYDAKFVEWRRKLRSFNGIEPAEPSEHFQGELRSYQKDGLGWIEFLSEFGFGGCLADDMGLGKTVQVLALLEKLRQVQKSKKNRTPSLVVVPRSLVFNWINEAARFAPNLTMVDYSGPDRSLPEGKECDVLITTYGILRRDILKLKDVKFHYAILDEAQAIKNANAQLTKACRLVQAKHRLAMSGTPVENHLGELWSLFEFLNPGMLGRSTAFANLVKEVGKRPVVSPRDADGNGEPVEKLNETPLAVLANAIRPFVLRRTKQQVLTELPEKMEQTLVCELEGEQKKLYRELKDFYRASLGKRIESNGLEKSKIHVLEALLRLRQAACHPGLVHHNKMNVPSAKIETLLEQVSEVVEEGHKALVFSQFTQLLAIVRKEFDARKFEYEYLDGQTRNRQQRVERFQSDPDCPLFLLSLKAGGHGLNLTAADYVFILDPWWNPAVEAQAIDRAHRIGQQRNVFAYRLIAKDTVEEKIAQLQESKRQLCEAIVAGNDSLIRTLTAEDLEILLG